jgi:hypothetical protein
VRLAGKGERVTERKGKGEGGRGTAGGREKKRRKEERMSRI